MRVYVDQVLELVRGGGPRVDERSPRRVRGLPIYFP